MECYVGIDLHGNNCVVSVLDEEDRELYAKRLPNDFSLIAGTLRPYSDQVQGIAVESTYNWYWLVDGLRSEGFDVRLVNTAAVKQYDGLKHGNDFSDARHLAHLLRLGILPTGYIYPKEERALQDLLRKRSQLVRTRSTQILSIGNLMARNLGKHPSGNEIKRWEEADIDALELLEEQKLAIKSNLAVMHCLDDQIKGLEKALLTKAKLRDEFQALKTVSGIGNVLALTIALETGEISRFKDAGNFASYARTVGSTRESNGKQKGKGNAKCGNKYLAWAFVEAAHFAVRYDETVKRWYQRKCARGPSVVAIKAVAHKLARACFHVMKGNEPFDVNRAFGMGG